jgi:hypothetical protein
MDEDSESGSGHICKEARKPLRNAGSSSITSYVFALLVGLAFLLWGAVFG